MRCIALLDDEANENEPTHVGFHLFWMKVRQKTFDENTSGCGKYKIALTDGGRGGPIAYNVLPVHADVCSTGMCLSACPKVLYQKFVPRVVTSSLEKSTL